jgi:hypothetical protein
MNCGFHTSLIEDMAADLSPEGQKNIQEWGQECFRDDPEEIFFEEECPPENCRVFGYISMWGSSYLVLSNSGQGETFSSREEYEKKHCPPKPNRFEVSNVCKAFDAQAVGSKVFAREAFFQLLRRQVEEKKEELQGQNFLHLPIEATYAVSVGVAPRTQNADDYCVRMWRGVAQAFLKRAKSLPPPERVAVVLYSREAYLADPDTQKDEAEFARVQASSCPWVVVAVLAFLGPKAPVSPFRFVANLAGGNNEYTNLGISEVKLLAKQVLDYDQNWCVVAD